MRVAMAGSYRSRVAHGGGSPELGGARQEQNQRVPQEVSDQWRWFARALAHRRRLDGGWRRGGGLRRRLELAGMSGVDANRLLELPCGLGKIVEHAKLEDNGRKGDVDGEVKIIDGRRMGRRRFWSTHWEKR